MSRRQNRLIARIRAQVIVLSVGLLSFASIQAAEPALPPVTQPATRPGSQPLSTATTFELKKIRIVGATRFTDHQLLSLPDVKRSIGKKTATLDDLEAARDAITQHYIQAGYINSGAVLEDQTIDDGVVTLTVIEGKLTDVHLQRLGKPRLVKRYILDRVDLGAGPPLNLNRLRDQLEILRQDPNIQRVNAELKPGLKPGESTLDLAVEETNPIQLGLDLNNKRSPSVGAERFYALASDTDLTGHGDALFLNYGITKGGFEHMRPAEDSDFRVDYTLPITRENTTLGFNITRSDDFVTEVPFNTANITSRLESLSITLRHPFYRSTTTEFAMSLTGTRRYNQTFLLGQPFAFSPGYDPKNGRSDVTAIRFGQEWTRRTETQTIALRSTFSLGLDALGSTITSNGQSDSRFFAWLGQAQYVRRVWQDSELIFRLDGQLADNPLPAIEQFSVGGFDTVRGYRENRLVRDDGVIASVECRIPIWRKANRPILDVAPFVDAGYAWDFHNDKSNPPQLISSAGVGLLYNPNNHVALQIYYGYPFKHFSKSNDIQDKGLHFDLLLNAFN